MIVTFSTYSYGWLPLWLQTKIPEKTLLMHVQQLFRMS
jgi:hypothetical protein